MPDTTVINETQSRTVAKAVSYRSLAAISSWIMVGWQSAIYVELSKTVIFYVCERAWLKTSWQCRDGKETMMRSVAKGIVYRSVATMAVAYWVGWESAIWLALVQTVIFVLNDRAWQLVGWGRAWPSAIS